MLYLSKGFIIFVMLVLSAQTCLKEEKRVSKDILGHWIHSFEEDSVGSKTYRFSSYKFPASRARGGFEIKANGEFIKYEIASQDGNIKVYGSWQPIDLNKIKVTFPAHNIIDTVKIVAVTPGYLKVQLATRT